MGLQCPDRNRQSVVSTGKFYRDNGGGHGAKVSNLRTNALTMHSQNSVLRWLGFLINANQTSYFQTVRRCRPTDAAGNISRWHSHII